MILYIAVHFTIFPMFEQILLLSIKRDRHLNLDFLVGGERPPPPYRAPPPNTTAKFCMRIQSVNRRIWGSLERMVIAFPNTLARLREIRGLG